MYTSLIKSGQKLPDWPDDMATNATGYINAIPPEKPDWEAWWKAEFEKCKDFNYWYSMTLAAQQADPKHNDNV